jgi:hypothetical protein
MIVRKQEKSVNLTALLNKRVDWYARYAILFNSLIYIVFFNFRLSKSLLNISRSKDNYWTILHDLDGYFLNGVEYDFCRLKRNYN